MLVECQRPISALIVCGKRTSLQVHTPPGVTGHCFLIVHPLYGSVLLLGRLSRKSAESLHSAVPRAVKHLQDSPLQKQQTPPSARAVL